MKIIISDDDGTVIEVLSIPFEFDADEIKAAADISELISQQYEVVEEDE